MSEKPGDPGPPAPFMDVDDDKSSQRSAEACELPPKAQDLPLESSLCPQGRPEQASVADERNAPALESSRIPPDTDSDQRKRVTFRDSVGGSMASPADRSSTMYQPPSDDQGRPRTGQFKIPPPNDETRCLFISNDFLVAHNPGSEHQDIPYLHETDVVTSEALPSVFTLATKAFLRMCHTQEDQLVLVMGQTGAGKKESTKMMIEELAFLSTERLLRNPLAKPPNKNFDYDSEKTSEKEEEFKTQASGTDEFYSLILKAHNLLEAFGCEGTRGSPNASRFGLYSEMHFSKEGILLGGKFMEYAPMYSPNLHIFKFLFQGANPEERKFWRLEEFREKKPVYQNAWIHPYFDDGCEALAQIRGLLVEIAAGNWRIESEVLNILVAIMHLQALEVLEDPAANLPGMTRGNNAVVPKDPNTVVYIAEELLGGVDPNVLWSLIATKTIVAGGNYCTEVNELHEALLARDQLVQCLFSHLFEWIVTAINRRISRESECDVTLGIISFPGLNEPDESGQKISDIGSWVHNFAGERMLARTLRRLDGSTPKIPPIISSESARARDVPAAVLMDEMSKDIEFAHFEYKNAEDKLYGILQRKYTEDKILSWSEGSADSGPSFSLLHTQSVSSNSTEYSVRRLLASIAPYMPPAAAVALQASGSSVLADIFNVENVDAINRPANQNYLDSRLRAQTNAWRRTVSRADRRMQRKFNQKNIKDKDKRVEEEAKLASLPPLPSNLNVYLTRFDEFFRSTADRPSWVVACVKPSKDFMSLDREIDDSFLNSQYEAFSLWRFFVQERENILRNSGFLYTYEFDTFVSLFMTSSRFPAQERKVAEPVGKMIDDYLQREVPIFMEKGGIQARRFYEVVGDARSGQVRLTETGFYLVLLSQTSIGSKTGLHRRRTTRITLSKPRAGPKATLKARRLGKRRPKGEPEYKEPRSTRRRFWLAIATVLTWWIPDRCLACAGKHTRGVRLAWREKLSINILIWALSAILIFFIAFFTQVLCPSAQLFKPEELATHDSSNEQAFFMAINGIVYDFSGFNHPAFSKKEIEDYILPLGGKDASSFFPRYNPENNTWPSECIGTSVTMAQLDHPNPQSGSVARFVAGDREMNKRQATVVSEPRCVSPYASELPGYCHSNVQFLRNIGVNGLTQVGSVAYAPETVASKIFLDDAWLVIDDAVYNITDILRFEPPIFDAAAITLFSQQRGKDMSERKGEVSSVFSCLQAAAFIGFVDNRSRISCVISEYLLLFTTGLVLLVMLVKFVAALQLGGKKHPEDIDKYVVLQVPCYTEDESSIRKTVDSLALTSYDDDKKLLFVVCDGMIRGSGNDIPTPEIVLRLFGVPESTFRHQPEPPLEYFAIGEGRKQLNRASVYAGQYAIHGRRVPYVVIVKCGAKDEVYRPGNRGKRDSQLVFMRFMNRVLQRAPMTPLDLDLHEKIFKVSGVEPARFEYILLVDADTQVLPDALTRLIVTCMADRSIMGISGETGISNERQSWVTMIQVFEYWISHHLSKAFESLFGTVTCLPGCFCMYRIRSSSKTGPTPILCDSQIIEQYSECEVDTLHRKNLLHLGEDRYLSTLMLSRFPAMKTKFIADAKCLTVVPDTFSVLLSQRRRWVNSTVHNLFELLFVDQLCGCLICSMRVIVALDLFSTLVMPASVVYAAYIVYLAITSSSENRITLIMIAAIYGLQALLFIVKRQWQHFGWMVLHLLSLPIFYCYIPLYSFWHFDDFSWGNTRVIAGEKSGKGAHDAREGREHFDPASIPMSTLEEHREKTRQLYLSNSDIKKSSLWVPSANSQMECAALGGAPARVKQSVSMQGLNRSSEGVSLAPFIPKSKSHTVDLAGMAAYTTGRLGHSGQRNDDELSESASVAVSVARSGISQGGSSMVSVDVVGSSTFSVADGDIVQPEGPTDQQLYSHVRDLLRNAGPNNVTKRQVRLALEEQLGMSLYSKRGRISDMIEELIGREVV